MRKYLIAGLLVWLPLGVTLLVVKLLVDIMDRTLLLLPPAWRPEALLGFNIPGLGVVLAVVVVLVTGVVVANLLGRKLFGIWEAILARIPLVRTIYGGVKQVAESLLSDRGKSFRKVMLIEYPRKGMWSLVFQTADDLGTVSTQLGEDAVAVFLPTTPNPTSGFVLIVPRRDVIELDVEVDDALKFIMSVGVAVPSPSAERVRKAVADHSRPVATVDSSS